MKIEFTKKQYKLLMDLVYAGNILINGFRDQEEINKEYEGLEYYIYSLAKEYGWQDYVEYDEEFKEYFPTKKFDEHMREKIYEYDDYVFWSKLPIELARRDAAKKLKEDINEENFNDFLKLVCKLEEKYERELEENGLDNVEIRSGDKKLTIAK
jgi:predicted nucleic acid-binding protein